MSMSDKSFNFENNDMMIQKVISIFILILAFVAQAAGSRLFNDPGYRSFWINRVSSQYGISLDKAYSNFKNLKSTEIIVAVIDTGVDYTHKDLKNNMWVNLNEILDNGIDDDYNGYIDDVHGINLLERTSSGNGTGNPMDTHFHGTFIAGIIAAEQNNKTGTVGIASNVKIMAIRAIPSDADEADKDVAEALIYAAVHGAKIINCSFGKKANQGGSLVAEALDFIAKEYGVLVFASSGNFQENIDRVPLYPASLTNDNLIVVAATDRDGKLTYFSSYGPVSVDVAAPGVDIYSTLLNNNYAFYFGTSVATPIVAGIAAEIWSKFPNLNFKEIKSVILNSTTPNKNLKNKILTGGHVDLYKALLMAQKISVKAI